MTKVLIKRMNDVVQSYVKDDEFMGSVLVVHSRDVLLNKGYGFANLEWSISNTPTTKYRLGSLTKQFTAAAMLLLEERGLLNIEDCIIQYIPNAPAAWKDIKIFNLLNHTHGIPNYTQLPAFAAITTFKKTPLEQVQLFIDKPLDFEPGTQYVYNNSGYVLLGYLIEVISCKSYGEFITEHIFNPLDMLDSGYDSHSKIIPQRATGYTKDANGISNASYLDMSLPYSAGSLYSTTEDLLKWIYGLFEEKLISAASLKKMTTPFKEHYGFGVEIKEVDGINVIMHVGGINGFNTTLVYCLETKTAVIVLSNLNTTGYVWDVGFLSQNIALKMVTLIHNKEVVIPSEKKVSPLQLDVLEQYCGVYRIKLGLDLTLTLNKNHLVALFSNQPKIILLAESESVFYSKVPDIQLKFVKNERDIVTHVCLSQSGYELIGTKDDAAFYDKIL